MRGRDRSQRHDAILLETAQDDPRAISRAAPVFAASRDEDRHHLEICTACYPRAQFERHFLEALQRSQNGGRASGILRERVLRTLAEDKGPD